MNESKTITSQRPVSPESARKENYFVCDAVFDFGSIYSELLLFSIQGKVLACCTFVGHHVSPWCVFFFFLGIVNKIPPLLSLASCVSQAALSIVFKLAGSQQVRAASFVAHSWDSSLGVASTYKQICRFLTGRGGSKQKKCCPEQFLKGTPEKLFSKINAALSGMESGMK